MECDVDSPVVAWCFCPMHKNTTFLILLGTLLVAGGVVLREREEMREWQVRQQLLNRQHVQPADNTASTPEINPATGCKIFKHPDVPITFEYPGEMKVISSHKDPPEKLLSFDIQDSMYELGFVFMPAGKGIQGDIVDEANFTLGASSFSMRLGEVVDNNKTSLIAFFPFEEEEKIGNILNVDVGEGILRFRLNCKDVCNNIESRTLLKQIVSSIRLASDPR